MSRQLAGMVTLGSARDERLPAVAARAACVWLFLGLESFSARSLELVHPRAAQALRGVAAPVVRAQLGYGLAVENPLPGWPMSRGERGAVLDWPGSSRGE